MVDKPATKDELSAVHKKLSEIMLKDLKDGNVNAAYMSVIVKFLKDNGIECVGPNNETLSDISKYSLPDLEEHDPETYQ